MAWYFHLALFLAVFWIAMKVGSWLAPRPVETDHCDHLFEHCGGQTWCHNCGKTWDTGDHPQN